MNKNNFYDVIIVGGGIAGLTASAYSAKKGLKTLLIEKQPKTGGLISTFKDEGFVFDAGVRAFENSGIIFPMLKQLGINIEFIKSNVSLGIENKIVSFDSEGKIDEYGEVLIEKFPESKQEIKNIVNEIKKIIDYMDVLYGIDNPLFIDYMKNKKYLFKTLLPWFIKYQKNMKKIKKLNIPVQDFLKSFTQNQKLIDMITQLFFKNTPTFFALSYFGSYLDYYYPKGGTYTFAKEMEKYTLENRGEILISTEVTEIIPNEGILKTADGDNYFFKEMIWAADLRTFYNIINTNGIEKKKILDNYKKKKELVDNKSANESVLTVFVYADKEKEYFEKMTNPHLFYTPTTKGTGDIDLENDFNSLIRNNDNNLEEIKRILFEKISEYLENTTYEISFPVLRDEILAPKGKTGVIVSTLIGYNITKFFYDNNFYDEFKSLCSGKIIEVITKNLFTELEGKIIKTSCSTPKTIERYTSNFQGAITGWSFDNQEMPSESEMIRINKSVFTPFSNIFQAGQWSFSPSGVPVSVLTGKLAYEKVLKNITHK
ncbi:MAG: phytoene desaturase family protein [Thermotogota bacterium]